MLYELKQLRKKKGITQNEIESDEILDFILIPNEVMRKHPTAYLLRINGTSMNRVLPDGCYALVDPSMKDVVDGHAYAVKVNGDASTAKKD